MKTQIRFGTFETNSSSTHAICISKSSISPVDGLQFEHGEFGWQEKEYADAQTKLSYWYTALINYGKNIEEYTQQAKDLLIAAGCEDLKFNDLKVDENGWFDSGYIDHGYDLGNWANKCIDDGSFLYFVLNPFSTLVLGNDNSERDIYEMIDESNYEEVIYKGN